MWGFSRELCETDHLQYHKQIVLMCCSLKGFAQSMCSSRICHKQLHCNSWARAVPRTSVFKKSREGFALARTVLETLCIVEDYCRNTGFWPEV